jgi:capsular polysaccharide transport system permease protein
VKQIPDPQVLAFAPTPSERTLARLKRIPRLFWLTVAIPTALASVYFGLIAADRYVSESRFVVRSPQRPMQAGSLSALLQGTAFSRSQDDAYSVHDFILSRDALQELDRELQVRKAFGHTGLDFPNRFPALDFDDSFEALHRYYQKRVSVDYDSASSVSVLRVDAFTAADAQRINQMLLDLSERLVNQISERARQDMIRFAADEVREAERRAKEATLALAAFRNQTVVVDPEKQSVIQLQQVAKLQEEIIATKTQLAQLRKYTPDNPQIPALVTRLDTLQRELDAEMSKVAGSRGSLAEKAVGYEPLVLERAFAERQLASAMTALETARSEAQRQQLYLERIVQPNLPDVAIEPRRLRSVGVVFVLGLIAWGIVSLLAASVREHLS